MENNKLNGKITKKAKQEKTPPKQTPGEEKVKITKVSKEKPKKKTEKELLIDENEALKLENSELAEKALRAIAELENFKKRMISEKENERKYFNMYLIEKLIPALDQFSIVVNLEVESKELKNYLVGFKMINDQIFQILADDGLKVIETKDKMFDPKIHYAQEKQKDLTKEKGLILNTIQTGYMYKQRIIRPAMVVVNEWSDENGNDK